MPCAFLLFRQHLHDPAADDDGGGGGGGGNVQDMDHASRLGITADDQEVIELLSAAVQGLGADSAAARADVGFL